MIVGIDLGTSTSEIAVLKGGLPVLIRDIAGSSKGFLPSVVAIGSDGTLRIGEAAAALLEVRPEATIAEVKRQMGTAARVTLDGESYSPQEISALILRHLKREAEAALGEPVTEAVITVPAYFTDVQRRATHDAGELAGLRVRRLVNEPTAAALAYGIERPHVEERVVVYDLGGGTFDVTLLELSEGVLDVVASTGNSQLGGKDFDDRLTAFLVTACRREMGVDLSASPRAHARLRGAAKRAKEDLSSAEGTRIEIDVSEGVRWEYTLTRGAFEAQIEDLVQSTTKQLDEALRQKRLKPGDVDTVLLVGGSSRVPLVRAVVSTYFGGRHLRTEVHPDEAVALGAAVLGGIEEQVINPSAIVITDVAPWTLGVAVTQDHGPREINGVFSPLILKQSTIPRTVTHHYATRYHRQRSVLIEVYQGDAPMCAANTKVGEFELADLEPAPAGADVEVSFTYNLNGELEVVARALGREGRVVLKPSATRLSDDEKAAARARLARWGADGRPEKAAEPPADPTSIAEQARRAPLYPRVKALIERAERGAPTLAAGVKTRVEVLLLEMRAALIANDERAVGVVEQALTNLLFELT
ncbi:MAG TPA: Hsp70 family protein [Gemmatimonadales bacterium]